MNINPSAAITSAASSVAGTSQAAAKGGESDEQAVDATSKQSAAEKPGGKSNETQALDAGEQSGDRGGDGRQVLDVFERHAEEEQSKQDDSPPESPASPEGHVDFEA